MPVDNERGRPCDRCGDEQTADALYPSGYRRRICRKCWWVEGEELAALRFAVEHQRGYADFFDWPDKRQKELGVLSMFAEEFRKAGGRIYNEQLTEPGRDPPDAVAISQSGASIGIELVELVDQVLIEREKREKRPQWRAWSCEELRQALLERVAKKDRGKPALVRDLSEYWAVVHTDEPALTPETVTQHLAGFQVGPCRLMTRCFLLMSYWPAIEGYPLVEIEVLTLG